MKPVFIAGCGDIGMRVAQLWQQRGAAVSALARSGASAQRLLKAGVGAVPGDLDKPGSLLGLPTRGALLYYFAPPPNEGDGDPRIEALLAALSRQHRPAKLVYLSTSGVYGDRGGDWVDETSPPNPQTARARRRLAAETAVRNWGKLHGVPVVILRVGGIYGPGRLPVDRITRGLPILREDQAPFTNRIHADDLATVCVLAMEQGQADQIYNVSDGTNGNMSEYFKGVADLLGLPHPPEVDREEAQRVMSPGMLSYLNESRRMDTHKLREELGFTPRYPDLKSGLASCREKAAPEPA